MTKIVLAPDSFKECLNAHDVCGALSAGIQEVLPDAVVCSKPMADGGEGTAGVLLQALDCREIAISTQGPLAKPLIAGYGLSRDGSTALVETARANGLDLVPTNLRNPLKTSTFGCGQLVADALMRRPARLLLTIGGSSTVDGGIGLARALGYRFLDGEGHEIPGGGGRLADLAGIEAPAQRPWSDVDIEVLCDVTNPLLGTNGAAHIFGPQKGATPAMVEVLENGLANLATVIERDLGVDARDEPGAGAAGGMGAGLMAFLNARLVRGANRVIELIGLEEALPGADLVVTGEGRTDAQTGSGKVCAAVAALAAGRNVPCVIVSGCVENPAAVIKELGVANAYALSSAGEPLAHSIAQAGNRLRAKGRELAETIARNGSIAR